MKKTILTLISLITAVGGYSTRENVIRGVRTDAWHLENTTGYIPKWLDEFK